MHGEVSTGRTESRNRIVHLFGQRHHDTFNPLGRVPPRFSEFLGVLLGEAEVAAGVAPVPLSLGRADGAVVVIAGLVIGLMGA